MGGAVAANQRRRLRPERGPDVDVTDLGIGGGPQIGLNWHVSEDMSLSWTFSYNRLWVRSFCDGNSCFDDSQDADESRVSVNVSLFFRTPDDVFGR